MFSFNAMTSGLASDSDKFKITITLRRAQKFGDKGTIQKFLFSCLSCTMKAASNYLDILYLRKTQEEEYNLEW